MASSFESMLIGGRGIEREIEKNKITQNKTKRGCARICGGNVP